MFTFVLLEFLIPIVLIILAVIIARQYGGKIVDKVNEFIKPFKGDEGEK